VEKHWGDWKPGDVQGGDPAGAAAARPRLRARALADETLPWVDVAFHAPAFSETDKEYAALDLLMDLTFGPTSDLYKRLVEDTRRWTSSSRTTPGTADPHCHRRGARART
jgi:zinc protease